MSGRSWGYQVVRLADAEELARKHAANLASGCPRTRRQWACAARSCTQAQEFECSYEYVTGKAGRVSRARRQYCFAHAARFAAKHGLPWPPEVVTPAPERLEPFTAHWGEGKDLVCPSCGKRGLWSTRFIAPPHEPFQLCSSCGWSTHDAQLRKVAECAAAAARGAVHAGD